MLQGNIKRVYIAVQLDDGTTQTIWLDNPAAFYHIFLKIKAQQPDKIFEIEGFLSEIQIPTNKE